jgi:hypothetical protein
LPDTKIISLWTLLDEHGLPQSTTPALRAGARVNN